MAGYYAPASVVGGLARQHRYRFPDRVERDVTMCKSLYNDLKPEANVFTFDDGRQMTMIVLTGTIPISYKGTRYNIPVSVWLDPSYPELPPTPMVCPTPTMVVKPGANVDVSGRVYLPYLHAWDQAQSNLCGLVAVMCEVFGQSPPVNSRANQPAAQPARPPPGPYASSTPYAQQPPPITPQYTQQPQTYAAPATQQYTPPVSHTSSNSSIRPNSNHTSLSALQKPAMEDDDAELQEGIKSSIIDHVTEVCLQKASVFAAEKRATIDELSANQQVLMAGAAQIGDIMERLSREEATVTSAIVSLRDKIAQLKTAVKSMEGNEKATIDDIVTTTAPLYKQILDQTAEDNAIDDIIYNLGKALESGRIDIQAYVKHLRNLAERQFRCRTIIHKARVQAKLD